MSIRHHVVTGETSDPDVPENISQMGDQGQVRRNTKRGLAESRRIILIWTVHIVAIAARAVLFHVKWFILKKMIQSDSGEGFPWLR